MRPEICVPGVVGHAWWGILAPAGTPKPIIEKITSELRKAIQLPDVNGFDLAARLAALADRPAVVLTSALDPCDYGRRVQGSGAVGFVAKSELTGARVKALLNGGD